MKPGKVPDPDKRKHGEEGHVRHDTACAGCAIDQLIREQIQLVLAHVSPEMRAQLLFDLKSTVGTK